MDSHLSVSSTSHTGTHISGVAAIANAFLFMYTYVNACHEHDDAKHDYY